MIPAAAWRRLLLHAAPLRRRFASSSFVTPPLRTGWHTHSLTSCHTFRVDIDPPVGRRHIRVHHINRANDLRKSCVLYVPGFMRHSSDLEVRHVANHCVDRGYECIIYDPEGLGMSSGYFSNVEFSNWMDDCEAAAACTRNPRLTLVAPSMGAIIGVKLAQRYPGRVSALLMVAPGITVFELTIREWIRTELSDEDKLRLSRGDTVDVQTYWGRLPLKRGVLERTYAAMPDLSSPIDVKGARVVLLHGKKDDVVPYRESYRLKKMLSNVRGDPEVVTVEGGGHRLNEPSDLRLLGSLIDMIMEEEEPDHWAEEEEELEDLVGGEEVLQQGNKEDNDDMKKH